MKRLLDILCRDTRGVSIPVKTLEEFMNTLYKMYSEVKSLTIANKAVLSTFLSFFYLNVII